jgi:hypothetical protein
MKTVAFSDILAEVCQLIGLDRSTLNDKSFNTIRDFASRRIGTIWDREEWPDANRFIRTFPGHPVQGIAFIEPPAITTETDSELTTESNVDLLTQTSENVISLKLDLDLNFPRVYLADFANDAYRKGTISQTEVGFDNPFYYTFEGTPTSIATKKYNFTYDTLTDTLGEYISSFYITLPYEATATLPTYEGPNGKLTTTAIFTGNPQRLVQMPTGSLQGLAAWERDPRTTTRAVQIDFMVEDLITVPGSTATVDVTYLRFLEDGEKFIQYRLDAPRLLGAKFTNSTLYSTGAQVYYDIFQQSSNYNPTTVTKGTRGNFWTALVPSSSVPPADPQNIYWQQVSIPYRFKDYLVNGVTADFLKSEGRTDEGVVFDGLAEQAVQQQIDVLIRQQGQIQKMNMAYTY